MQIGGKGEPLYHEMLQPAPRAFGPFGPCERPKQGPGATFTHQTRHPAPASPLPHRWPPCDIPEMSP